MRLSPPPRTCRPLAAALVLCTLLAPSLTPSAVAQDLSSEEVKRSIDRGVAALAKLQRANGSWDSPGVSHIPGSTALCVLALLNSGEPVDSPPVAAGLKYLRDLPTGEIVGGGTYDTSLALMAFAAAKEPRRDSARMQSLTRALEDGRVKEGRNRGGWGYGLPSVGGSADRSNSQYAVLGLRDAAYAGVPVQRQTWEDIANYWVGPNAQNRDGGYTYTGAGGGARGSMTVAGIATLSILKSMLRQDELNPDGTPNCCGENDAERELERSVEAASDWLTRYFAVSRNPQYNSHTLYYLYGLERAGRLAGRRFFGEHDWYREGAAWLLRNQNPRTGGWVGNGFGETNEIVGTAFSLLFLAKGLSPVLMNKLKYDDGQAGDDAWQTHPADARNLTFHVSGLPKWPKLVTWQVLDLQKAVAAGDLAGALQGPVTLITGRDAPQFSPVEVKFLRDYVDAGGFLLGVATCDGGDFRAGFERLVAQMYPEDAPKLDRLTEEHPVFRSEYLLNADVVELYGADLGCRTPIMFSPVDLSCYWDLWTPYDLPDRDPQLLTQITQKVNTGVNILAYATGREPPDKLEAKDPVAEVGARDAVERGLLQVAKLRHEGEWDAAPRALRNLLLALNRTAGVAASTKVKSLTPGDMNVFRYPVLYMHGRGAFSLGQAERERLRTYLENGGVLFADACCGSEPFDRAMRELMGELFPESPLTRIPPDHELFSEQIGFDLSRVRRRVPAAVGAGALDADVVVGEPFLEGVTVNGQLAVIYSKYDISCALERQTTAACAGYLPEDALKIGINALRYALLRDPVAPEQ
ncbi:DUF4159 domain-containing protein [Alienimonas californiensis]|uniref:DUF4159 domain-containing protein n=1 Tax=Alienimonas californiensis TaxID=2527989 RepID=A0A517P9S7_9PLAN|nr:DUF4159 domain-containing protein [Alienimonas californiensis]QDT16118.1 hypothetical protein CA12_22160 [Alienimonas californiensis]